MEALVNPDIMCSLLPSQDTEGHKTVNQYIKLRRLGTGSYGKVVLHKDSITGKLYAMKILHRCVHVSSHGPMCSEFDSQAGYYLQLHLLLKSLLSNAEDGCNFKGTGLGFRNL
jgi:serine/threonine protein kinase